MGHAKEAGFASVLKYKIVSIAPDQYWWVFVPTHRRNDILILDGALPPTLSASQIKATRGDQEYAVDSFRPAAGLTRVAVFDYSGMKAQEASGLAEEMRSYLLRLPDDDTKTLVIGWGGSEYRFRGREMSYLLLDRESTSTSASNWKVASTRQRSA